MNPEEINLMIAGLWEVVDELADVRSNVSYLKAKRYNSSVRMIDVRSGIRSIDERLAHIEARLREVLSPVEYIMMADDI